MAILGEPIGQAGLYFREEARKAFNQVLPGTFHERHIKTSFDPSQNTGDGAFIDDGKGNLIPAITFELPTPPTQHPEPSTMAA